MKKFAFILLFILKVYSATSQQQTLFTDRNYNKSLELSKSENKPLVILFYASWCPHCNVMKKEVFTDSLVADFYQKNFICMAVDSESDYGRELRIKFKNKFKVINFPTFAFLDTNENLLYCTTGELNKDKFLAEGKNVLQPENQLPNLKNDFLNESSNPEKCLKYITTIRKAGIDATPIAQKYFAGKTTEERFTEVNWKIFANGINNFDTDEFKFTVKNKDAFAKIVSPTRVDKKIVYTISETLKPLVESNDTINYNKKRLVAESFQIRKVDSLLYRFDLQIVSQSTNWKKYQKITVNNVEKFSWNDSVVLYEICDTYLQTVKDKQGLLQAVNWAKHLLSFGESLDRYKILSKLLIKVKDYKQALEYAQRGKILADSLGLNAEEINSLLAEIKKH